MLHEKRKRNVLHIMYVPTEVHLIVGKKIVFGIEEYFDGIRYLDVSPKKSGHGYNVSIYRIF